jgi:hypothetical protein
LDVHLTPERIDSLLAGRVIPVTNVVFEEAVQEVLTGRYGVTRGSASSVLAGSVF